MDDPIQRVEATILAFLTPLQYQTLHNLQQLTVVTYPPISCLHQLRSYVLLSQAAGAIAAPGPPSWALPFPLRPAHDLSILMGSRQIRIHQDLPLQAYDWLRPWAVVPHLKRGEGHTAISYHHCKLVHRCPLVVPVRPAQHRGLEVLARSLQQYPQSTCSLSSYGRHKVGNNCPL